MFRILGSRKRLCDGLSRRDFLHVGGLGALGIGLANALRLQGEPNGTSTSRATRFGKAKACILLFPYGSPPQHETFDPKPDAPTEIQGELKAIRTAVPGVMIGERLPGIARIVDRLTIVRSLTHPYPEHGVAYALSGIPTYTPALETRPRDPMHWPFIGSVVDYLEEKCHPSPPSPLPQGARGESFIPRNIGLPWLLNSKTDLNVSAGPYAAFLGQGYDPVWTDFDGAGTRIAPHYTDGQSKDFLDPFAGTTQAGRFRVSTIGPNSDVNGPKAPDDIPIERLNLRRSLLQQFDAARQSLDRAASEQPFEKFQRMAFSLIASSRMRDALDIGKETLAVRERYGLTLFGQSCLAARRLVEAGCKFVTVFWDGYGQFANCAWDTHNNHYPRLKEYLLPGFDQAYPALILDLEARGLLDETLVLWMSEHGRTPRIDPKPKGAGRHHWSRAYSIALAGGGSARGKVVGSTDKQGGDVRETPVSPKDILATAFHLLGIDPSTTIPDSLGRPVPIAGAGQLRSELLG
ncbi:MAG TPA: DUF1501 domain-containing protein [Gemmataceae bacterium]|nr:DUF1501 domain-containing protein [Gemmataceae bacterium]